MKLRILLGVIAFALLFASSRCDAAIKNIIYCIGDGMGPDQVRAGHDFLGQNLSFESFANQGYLTTLTAAGYPVIPDSAANGTALATGVTVDVGVVSTAIPGDGSELPTLLEYYKSIGKSTGLVTTSYMTDATPAAFGAHSSTRTDAAQIADDYLTQSKPNVLLGGGGNGMTVEAAAAAGYSVVTDASELLAVNAATTNYLSGQFGSGQMAYEYDGVGSQPHLTHMTSIALNVLSANSNGFFLMLEGGNIDHANHANDMTRMVREVKEFSDSVQAALNWAAGRDDTLIIVTADHESGGLTAVSNNGANNDPGGLWKTTGHSLEDVPVYAWGKGAGAVSGFMKNTDLFNVAKGVAAPRPQLIAETSFLEATEGAASYQSATGKELGFTSVSNDLGSGLHLAEVFDSIESPTRFRVSNKSAVVAFDSVDISKRSAVTVSVQISVQDVFTDNDYFRATLTDGVNSIDLVRIEGDSLNALTDNTWYAYSAAVPVGWTNVQLIISASDGSDSDSIAIDFDRIQISGFVVPEPAMAISLIASGLFLALRVYKSRT